MVKTPTGFVITARNSNTFIKTWWVSILTFCFSIIRLSLREMIFSTGCPLKRNLVRISKNYVIILEIIYLFHFKFPLYLKKRRQGFLSKTRQYAENIRWWWWWRWWRVKGSAYLLFVWSKNVELKNCI